jgi:hypothetical protein
VVAIIQKYQKISLPDWKDNGLTEVSMIKSLNSPPWKFACPTKPDLHKMPAESCHQGNLPSSVMNDKFSGLPAGINQRIFENLG